MNNRWCSLTIIKLASQNIHDFTKVFCHKVWSYTVIALCGTYVNIHHVCTYVLLSCVCICVCVPPYVYTCVFLHVFMRVCVGLSICVYVKEGITHTYCCRMSLCSTWLLYYLTSSMCSLTETNQRKTLSTLLSCKHYSISCNTPHTAVWYIYLSVC